MNDLLPSEVTPAIADKVLEDLRYGLPPSTLTRAFTVGRRDQLDQLERSLRNGSAEPLLLRANYGSGKSHLLRVVREAALEHGYAVALVEVNAQEGIRFNRLDLVFGAVCRNLEVPGMTGRGIGSLFELFRDVVDEEVSLAADELYGEITDFGRWSYSDALSSPPMFVALRAWVHAAHQPSIRDLAEAWLHQPEQYRSERKSLYNQLIRSFRSDFLEPRPDWQFYADDLLVFHTSGHQNAWAGLADLDLIARASGLRGLVLLFDEFEDVIQGLNNREYQQRAFWNLFEFFRGRRFPGPCYFAVTPDFVEKCKDELLRRGVYEFPYERFDQLPAFQLEPISVEDFFDLGLRIRELHQIAYEWDARHELSSEDIDQLGRSVYARPSPDRVRQAVKALVDQLDELLDEDVE